MSIPSADDPEPTLRAGCVRLRFRWAADRWIHSIECLRDGSWDLLAEPIHAEADASRVVSPTYQEVHAQPPEQGEQILAIGRWGKHHFSAVFSLNVREDATILSVDVADRCREPFEAFGCTYRAVLVPSQLVEANPERAAWEHSCGLTRIETEPPDNLAVAELGRVGMSVQVHATIVPGSFTHRCRYRWVFTQAP